MEIREILSQAWAEVEAADLPAELQGQAFGIAVEMLRAGSPQLAVPPVAVEHPPTGANDAGSTSTPTSEASFFAKLAQETTLDRDDLERVFHFKDSDNSVGINLPARKLGSNTAAQMRTVAQLIVLARVYGLDSPSVPFNTVRDECSRLGCLDSGNFANRVGSTQGLVTSGPSSARVLKVNSQSLEALASRFTAVVSA